MKHDVQHDLDMPTAKKVVDHAFEEYQRRYPDFQPTLTWVSATKAEVTFNAKGLKLHGAMTLEEKNIAADLDVPFLLRPFQKKALDVIEREVRFWVGKAKAGEI